MSKKTAALCAALNIPRVALFLMGLSGIGYCIDCFVYDRSCFEAIGITVICFALARTLGAVRKWLLTPEE